MALWGGFAITGVPLASASRRRRECVFPFSNWLLKCQVSLTWAYIAFAFRFLT